MLRFQNPRDPKSLVSRSLLYLPRTFLVLKKELYFFPIHQGLKEESGEGAPRTWPQATNGSAKHAPDLENQLCSFPVHQRLRESLGSTQPAIRQCKLWMGSVLWRWSQGLWVWESRRQDSTAHLPFFQCLRPFCLLSTRAILFSCTIQPFFF